MAGFEGGSEVINNGTVDPKNVAIAAAVGAALPGVNALGSKVTTPARALAERFVPGRPGRTANPDADIAHQAVDDPDTVDPHASALAEPPPSVGEAQAQTTGNPQSAPSRSERVYKKDNDPSEQARYKAALDDPEVMREFRP